MKVCSKVYGCGEDTLLVLAFALSVELLPPLCYIVECGLVVSKYFYGFTLAEKYVSYCCIL